MVFVECLANLGELPPRGATFVFLPVKVARSAGGPGRAIAFLP
jgi:kynurenine formamidase